MTACVGSEKHTGQAYISSKPDHPQCQRYRQRHRHRLTIRPKPVFLLIIHALILFLLDRTLVIHQIHILRFPLDSNHLYTLIPFFFITDTDRS